VKYKVIQVLCKEIKIALSLLLGLFSVYGGLLKKLDGAAGLRKGSCLFPCGLLAQSKNSILLEP